MAAGGALYALFQVDAFPPPVAPLFGSPAVYVTVGLLAGAVWAAAADLPAEGWRPDTTPGLLVSTGGGLLVAVLLAAALAGVGTGTGTAGDVSPLLPALILVAAVGLAAGVWVGLRWLREVSAVGTVGPVVVFGHALDGVSTAVGYGLLGFGEQTPLSRVVIEAGAALPTAEFVGAGWLFVAVKLALAAAVLVLFEPYVREEPTEGYLLLAVVAAVGLGPGAHNLLLFAIVG
jgi:uncharacterized membrane protein